MAKSKFLDILVVSQMKKLTDFIKLLNLFWEIIWQI